MTPKHKHSRYGMNPFDQQLPRIETYEVPFSFLISRYPDTNVESQKVCVVPQAN